MERLTDIPTKQHYIELFRRFGFNCFPIPEGQKAGDSRYQGAKTLENLSIREDENYGVLPMEGKGNAIIDLDDKERYRSFAKHMIEQGYMVIETPSGWHIPVVGLSGNIQKTELFDYSVSQEKIIEIQGSKHYVVGCGSKAYSKKLGGVGEYANKGSEKIWNANKMDFHQFIDEVCKQCKVTGREHSGRGSNYYFRKRFAEGLTPTKGTSNSYFFNGAVQCNTDGLSHNEAIEKIRVVYDKWVQTSEFSDRPWSNIESTINNVYDQDIKLKTGRPKGSGSIDRTEIAKSILNDRQLYSNPQTHVIFENRGGFLKKINDTLKKDIVKSHPEMEKSDYEAILFKLESLADDIPNTNKQITVFKNGIRHRMTKEEVVTQEIADMGFENYDYLEPVKENEPKKFLKMMFENIPQKEHPRLKAGLKAVLESSLDSRISVIHGVSGVGKTTSLLILAKILGQYAMVAELDQLLQDRFIRAKIEGLRLLVLQDLPDTWKDFSAIKTMTGESVKQERRFMQDSSEFENKIKIWASANYLAKIPDNEKNAMYTRRLSLIHNVRRTAYSDNPNLIDEIVDEEAEKIVSWIFNLTPQECQYEDPSTVKNEWEALASPEIGWLKKKYMIRTDGSESSVSVAMLRDNYERSSGNLSDIKTFKKILYEIGYVIKSNMIENIIERPIQGLRNATLD